jgi:hypothetical protein
VLAIFGSRVAVAVAGLLWAAAAPAQQLDHTCIASVAGQSVRVNPDGTYVIRNVPAVGAYFRVQVVCQRGGLTQTGVSEYFRPVPGQTYAVGPIALLPPPVTLVSIVASTNAAQLGKPPSQALMTVIAHYSDGTQKDVTPASEHTTYETSDPRVVTVDQDGRIDAQGLGNAFVTARNEGRTATVGIAVDFDPGTRVVGYVFDDQGRPVAGATVSVLRFPPSVTSLSDGRFEFPAAQVPARQGNLVVIAERTVGTNRQFGTTRNLPPVPGGITDAGMIVMTDPACAFETDFGPALVIGDDRPVRVAFAQGFTFPFTGQVFDACWVSPNGNVQLGGQGDRTFRPNIPPALAEAQGKVAALWLDLDPTRGGSVHVRQHPDRLVVTWFQVPERTLGGTNTFQVVLRDDGRIAMIYNGLTQNGSLEDVLVGVGPAPISWVNLHDLSAGPATISGEGAFEGFTPQNRLDLDLGCLEWTPNVAAGFDVGYRRIALPGRAGPFGGIAQSDDGRALAAADLVATSTVDPTFVRTVRTDRAGQFLLDAVPMPGGVVVTTADRAIAGGHVLRSAIEPERLDVRPRPRPAAK